MEAMPAEMTGAGKMSPAKMTAAMSPTMEMSVTSSMATTVSAAMSTTMSTAVTAASRIHGTGQNGRQRSNGKCHDKLGRDREQLASSPAGFPANEERGTEPKVPQRI